MLIAVLHARGLPAAAEILDRTRPFAGVPPAISRSQHGAIIAGWPAHARLSLASDLAVEGTVEAPGDVLAKDALEWLPKARGDFSLMAITADGIVLASGPVGGYRPVYVVQGNEWVAASTRLRAVLQLVGGKPALDQDYVLASAIADYPLSPTATPYRNIQRVPMCEAWVLRPGSSVRRLSLWSRPPHRELRGDDQELASVLKSAIEASVERAVRGSTRAGVMMSGGVDSSSVFLTAESLRKSGRVVSPVEAYAWEFDTPDPGDDRPFRRAVERRAGRPGWPVAPADGGAFARRAFVLDAAPCTDVPCPLWLALDATAAQHGVDRILTGMGGDNILEGNPRLLGEVALRGAPLSALRKAVALRNLSYMTTLRRISHYVVRPSVRAMTPEILRAVYRKRVRRRRFDWMARAYDAWLERRASGAMAKAPLTLDSSPAERYATLVRIPFMADQAVIRSQQEEVTRCRRVDPLFDDELVRLISSLPPLSLLAGNRTRGLMRLAMSDVLPEEVTNRASKAFMEPAVYAMVTAGGGFAVFEDLARTRRLADLGVVDPKRFRAHFERLSTNPLGPYWWSVWPALAVEEFLRQYDEGWTS